MIVFLGAKQPKLDFTQTKYDRPINLLVVQLKAVQANNLDFHLAYYLGKFDSEAPAGVAFDVISNDVGFTPLIGHIKTGGRSCKQVKVANTSKDTLNLIEKLTANPKEKRPKKVVSLRNFIASNLGIQGNEVAIQNQLNKLVAANLISLSDNGVEYKQ